MSFEHYWGGIQLIQLLAPLIIPLGTIMTPEQRPRSKLGTQLCGLKLQKGLKKLIEYNTHFPKTNKKTDKTYLFVERSKVNDNEKLIKYNK